MTTRIALPVTNGVTTFELNDFVGYQMLIPLFATPPTAGRMKIEYQQFTAGPWRTVPEANNLDLTTNPVAIIGGVVSALRFTLTGMSGGAGLVVVAVASDQWPHGGMPAGLFTGLRAITTQPYTEANVKNGVQYSLRAVWPLADQIAAAGVRRVWFKTGSKPVLIKLRDVQFVGEELTIQLFSGPTGVSGGTNLAISNYNGINPVTATAQAKKNVTVTGNGTEFGGSDPEYFFGSANAPQRNAASIPQGRERVLPANTEFLVVITNTGTGTARLQYFLDWYEGGTDLPL